MDLVKKMQNDDDAINSAFDKLLPVMESLTTAELQVMGAVGEDIRRARAARARVVQMERMQTLLGWLKTQIENAGVGVKVDIVCDKDSIAVRPYKGRRAPDKALAEYGAVLSMVYARNDGSVLIAVYEHTYLFTLSLVK